LTHYDIENILGEGAFGQVNKVIHKTTKITRAMKTISKETLINENKEKLLSELNILKKLDHPNIVRIYEIYSDILNYYLIMEYIYIIIYIRYCSGGELFDKIRQLKSFTE